MAILVLGLVWWTTAHDARIAATPATGWERLSTAHLIWQVLMFKSVYVYVHVCNVHMNYAKFYRLVNVKFNGFTIHEGIELVLQQIGIYT